VIVREEHFYFDQRKSASASQALALFFVTIRRGWLEKAQTPHSVPSKESLGCQTSYETAYNIYSTAHPVQAVNMAQF
jgi:hypothetical protein